VIVQTFVQPLQPSPLASSQSSPAVKIAATRGRAVAVAPVAVSQIAVVADFERV